MNFIRTAIPDVILIEPKIFGDERGYFFESFKKKEFEDFLGYSVNFIQDNESKSAYGVLRGLHFQKPPFAQAKLVRVIKGAVLDVAVDVRIGSPTYGQTVAIELDEFSKKQLFVPRGFAHGFVTLMEDTIFSYKVDNYYNKQSEGGINFDDPDLNIDWKLPNEDLILSEKDRNQSCFTEVKDFSYNSNPNA